jgi:hypothetical protein
MDRGVVLIFIVLVIVAILSFLSMADSGVKTGGSEETFTPDGEVGFAEYFNRRQ